MNKRDFLKPKKFKIKAKSICFSSTQYMTDLEKKKIYINFVSFLNNHFSFTTFKKNLYNHFHTHCGFIAHTNLYGFYGEYFLVGAKFNKLAFDKPLPQYENIGYISVTNEDSVNESFYAIYEELNGQRDGLGEFYETIMSNHNYGGYSDYKDLDDAIKEVFFEYVQLFREEIKRANKAYFDFQKKEDIKELKKEQKEATQEANILLEKANGLESKLQEQKVIQDQISLRSNFNSGQTSLFDFVAA